MDQSSVILYESGDSEFWNRQVSCWGKTDITQAEYCRQNNLNLSTFGYWKRKLVQASASEGFVEILVKEEIPLAEESSSPIKLLIGDDIAIEVPDRFSPDLLRSLVLVLRDLP